MIPRPRPLRPSSPAARTLAAALLAAAALSAAAAPLSPLPPPPELAAKAAVVVDAATGTILFAKNPDLVVPPASLTKLVALHVAYREIAAGRLSKDELVEIDPRDCSPYVPYGSSLMYLRPGMKVTVLDLMRGMAVVSGNDGAFALARRIAGSNEAFADKMNAAMAELGLPRLRFVEPSGLSELNSVTARDFAAFCLAYLREHPESLAELHSLRWIEFPRAEHAVPGYEPEGRIIQYNRNDLVLNYEGADGLKTGYIIESGYNLAATAERGGSRFLLVTLGGGGSTSAGGGALRSRDGRNLLDWAFARFETRRPELPDFAAVRAWYGKEKEIVPVPAAPLAVTLRREEAAGLSVRVDLAPSAVAPVAAGARLGEVVYASGDRVLRRVELVAPEAVPRGNFLVQLRDAVLRLFSRLFGRDRKAA